MDQSLFSAESKDHANSNLFNSKFNGLGAALSDCRQIADLYPVEFLCTFVHERLSSSPRVR